VSDSGDNEIDPSIRIVLIVLISNFSDGSLYLFTSSVSIVVIRLKAQIRHLRSIVKTSGNVMLVTCDGAGTLGTEVDLSQKRYTNGQTFKFKKSQCPSC
jgi:hypothetical protein